MKNAVSNYVKSSLEELSKVTWPTKQQAIKLTIIVFVFVLVFALFLGVFDYLFSQAHTFVITNLR